jgi:hypothetical protein
VVRSQPGQIVHETLSLKNPSQKRAGGVAQGVGPELKPQYPHRKKKKQPKNQNPSFQHSYPVFHFVKIMASVLEKIK